MSNEQSPVDSARSAVAGSGRREMSIWTKLGVLGMIGALALSFVWFNALYSHRAKKEDGQKQAGYTGGGMDYTAPPPSATPVNRGSSLPLPSGSTMTQRFSMGNQNTPENSAIFAYADQNTNAPSEPSFSLPSKPAIAPDGSMEAQQKPQPEASPLQQRLTPMKMESEKATVLSNPDMTITEGTIIPCSLQTAVVSELPGLLTCVVPTDIRGTTGNVVLLDRGTKIVGQIQRGLLQGQNRVFVDWTRAETPDHVIVPLNSPGTDELGRSGQAGAVNNHLWERFGGAVALTLIQGAMEAGIAEAAGGGGGGGSGNSTQQQAALGFIYSTQSNGQTIANTALQSTINIPPTLTKTRATPLVSSSRTISIFPTFTKSASIKGKHWAMRSEAALQLDWLMKPLGPWLDDPTTEELCINRPGELYVRQKGVFRHETVELDYADLEDIAILAGALRKQDIGPRNPLCATELPGGERLQICIPPSVPEGTISLTIRKPGRSVQPLQNVTSRYHIARWNKWEHRKEAKQRDSSALLALYDSGDLEGFLKKCVASRLTILLCGATGSGKTTMSKSLIDAIPAEERIITIEDTLELVIPQPNHVRLMYSKDGIGLSNINAESLLQASLRMRPDRVLLQELRDDAAWTYVNEVVSGHPGSITTIHGEDPGDGFKKLFALAKGSPQGGRWDDDTLMNFLGSAIDVIIPFHNDGPLYEIREVWFAADAARRGETAAQLLAA